MNSYLFYVFSRNICIRNLATFAPGFQTQTYRGFGYCFHNFYVKNIAANIKQSKIQSFIVGKDFTYGAGIVSARATDFYARNETFFDNLAVNLGNSFNFYDNEQGTYIFDSKFIGEQLGSLATMVITHYSVLTIFNCIYENITLIKSSYYYFF